MIGKLEITSNVKEIDFMESVLNMASSGYEGSCSTSLMFMLYYIHGTLIKFVYYNYLIEQTKRHSTPQVR